MPLGVCSDREILLKGLQGLVVGWFPEDIAPSVAVVVQGRLGLVSHMAEAI
ncbi:hypothetical protein LguiB_009483 [Lonicera macranthoides]